MLENENKRRFSRVNLHAPLRCQVRGEALFEDTLSNDISEGGASFVSNNFIAPNTNLRIEISLLSRVLHPMAKVIWASHVPYSYRKKLGVEFVEIDPAEKKYLNEYITMQQEQ